MYRKIRWKGDKKRRWKGGETLNHLENHCIFVSQEIHLKCYLEWLEVNIHAHRSLEEEAWRNRACHSPSIPWACLLHLCWPCRSGLPHSLNPTCNDRGGCKVGIAVLEKDVLKEILQYARASLGFFFFFFQTPLNSLSKSEDGRSWCSWGPWTSLTRAGREHGRTSSSGDFWRA